MADGINRIGTGSSYGLGAFFNKKEVKEEKQAQEAPVLPQTVDVDADKVMEFLSANNIFVPVKPETGVKLDKAAEDRIAGFMADFETMFAITEKEVGRELAPVILDAMSEKFVSDLK